MSSLTVMSHNSPAPAPGEPGNSGPSAHPAPAPARQNGTKGLVNQQDDHPMVDTT